MKACGRRASTALLLAFFAVFCSTDPLFAQRRGASRDGASRGGGTGSAMESLVPVEYDRAPFDIDRGRLPRAYGGHNIQVIYSSVQDSMAKGARGREAEGPDAEGTGQGAGLIPAGTLKAGSIYAFQVKPEEISYDKRRQMMQVYCQLWTIPAQATADKTKSGFRIDYIPQVDNTYAYTAADGKRIEIEEIKFREYTVAFGNLDEFPVEKAGLPGVEQAKGKPPSSLDDALRDGTIAAGIPAAKAEAEQLERNTRLLVLCNLALPYATSETIHTKGTPEKPGEYLAQHRYLHVRLLQLWFYDAYSGRILMKIKPGEIKGRPRPPQP